jgi:hypothetical protein
MNIITKLFKKKDKIDLSKYARLPLDLLDSNSHPFDDWKDPELEIPEGWEKMFNFYACIYQLYMFYMITSEKLGNDLAVIVVEIMSNYDKEAHGDTSLNIYKNIINIHSAVRQLLDNPYTEIVDNKKEQMPLEYGLAKRFLCSDIVSPINLKEEEIKNSNLVPLLGMCLFHAKQPAIAYFENILDRIEINKNA